MIYITSLIFVSLLIVLNQLAKRKLSFFKRNIIAIIMGVIFGVIVFYGFGMQNGVTSEFEQFEYLLKIVSDTYLRLLRMMIVPIIFISIFTTIINLEAGTKIGKMVFQLIAYFSVTVLVAAVLAIVASIFGEFGQMAQNIEISAEVSESILGRQETVGDASIFAVLHGLILNIPSSISAAFAANNVIGTLIVAALFGFATKFMYIKKGSVIKPVIDLANASKEIVHSVVITIIKLTPYGIFALLTRSVATRGPQIFGDYAKFIFISYVTMLILILIHLFVVSTITRRNPLKYIKALGTPLITGFASQSSAATLPVTVEALEEEVGINSGIANLGATLGTSMGMGACGGMWPTFMVIFGILITNMIDPGTIVISFTTILLLLIAVLLSSFGIAGVPGTATFASITAMTIFGIDPAIQGAVLMFALPVDALIDMGRTSTNIFGVASAATVVDYINQEK